MWGCCRGQEHQGSAIRSSVHEKTLGELAPSSAQEGWGRHLGGVPSSCSCSATAPRAVGGCCSTSTATAFPLSALLPLRQSLRPRCLLLAVLPAPNSLFLSDELAEPRVSWPAPGSAVLVGVYFLLLLEEVALADALDPEVFSALSPGEGGAT